MTNRSVVLVSGGMLRPAGATGIQGGAEWEKERMGAGGGRGSAMCLYITAAGSGCCWMRSVLCRVYGWGVKSNHLHLSAAAGYYGYERGNGGALVCVWGVMIYYINN